MADDSSIHIHRLLSPPDNLRALLPGGVWFLRRYVHLSETTIRWSRSSGDASVRAGRVLTAFRMSSSRPPAMASSAIWPAASSGLVSRLLYLYALQYRLE